MSLARILAGRRDYFNFNEETQKSTCQVVNEKSGKHCGVELVGKNPSNLVNHLSRLHKVAHTEFEQKEKTKANLKQGIKRPITDKSQSGVKSQSLEQCLTRKIVTWAKDSVEHKQRTTAVMDMLISTGYPITMVDHPSFRNMIQAMDSKYTVPGIFYDILEDVVFLKLFHFLIIKLKITSTNHFQFVALLRNCLKVCIKECKKIV